MLMFSYVQKTDLAFVGKSMRCEVERERIA